MNGAESLVETLAAGGVEVCFANPGPSEMHFVAALDRTRRMRCVLGLFEGVVSGAADGYGRMAGKPACTLLHLALGTLLWATTLGMTLQLAPARERAPRRAEAVAA